MFEIIKQEAIKDKIHYILRCSVCGKKYEDTVEPFLSSNWDCESKRCVKLDKKNSGMVDKAISGEISKKSWHTWLKNSKVSGFFDFHPDENVTQQAKNYKLY